MAYLNTYCTDAENVVETYCVIVDVPKDVDVGTPRVVAVDPILE